MIDHPTSNQLERLMSGTPSPAVPVTPLIEILYPRKRARSRARTRRRGRFLIWPEEHWGECLFLSNGYSFLCRGGKC